MIFDDHHFGTSMPSGGHPPHQLAASFYRRITIWNEFAYSRLTDRMSFDVSAMHARGIEAYKLYAAHCLLLAKQAPGREAKLVLLDMARAWLLLADQSQKNDQTVLVYETPEQR